MTPSKIAGGIAGAILFAGGGAGIADQAVNPYTTVGTKLEIAKTSTIPEGGMDKVSVDTTQPKITLSKFNGELNMGVTYQGLQATGNRPFLSDKVQWSDAHQTMQVVPLAASSTMEDGGYEINILLNAEPASNVFNFSIDDADQLDFFYQAPLWQEAGLKAATKECTDTDCNMDGQSHRPDNVVDSYAVYYKNHANHIEGQTNYATGKAYHIFRPKVTDTNGVSVWANLAYANGILIVTVPQTFLDTAMYPVIVDPTFGYSTIGGSGFGLATDRVDLINPHVGINGDKITQYSLYADCLSSSGTIDIATYTIVSGIPSTRLDTPTTFTINSATPQWWNSGVLSISLVGGTNYDVAAGNAVDLGACSVGSSDQVYRDAGTPNTSKASTGALPSSWSETGTEAFLYSWYATYTAGASGSTHGQAYLKNSTGYINKASGYVK